MIISQNALVSIPSWLIMGLSRYGNTEMKTETREIYIDFVIRLYKPLETNFNRYTRNGENPIHEKMRNPIPDFLIKSYTRKNDKEVI